MFGRYVEPFLGGGAVFFHHLPKRSVLSDINPKLINVYVSIRDNWQYVWEILSKHQDHHCKEYYYQEREKVYTNASDKAAQFLYLNRACWNGLYRENLAGVFNVPIGTKTKIISESDDFAQISLALKNSDILSQDFSATISSAGDGDFIFVDPPYTTAHNFNGFVKYNQSIFKWEDQIRLRDSLVAAGNRGAKVLLTNAFHTSVSNLYETFPIQIQLPRHSVISGPSSGRKQTSEVIITNYEP
ncbi:DNA adenine methylase [Mesorhizobium opportunistum]|uniref:DNA adenine methylase n=1 Tax=Mesorhizobium opportunistum TaxID=593909 RepID=UPI00333D4966